MFRKAIILFSGAPLSGKGTHSKLLAKSLGLPVISSGDVFREEAASKSSLGLELANYMNAGVLVPDILVQNVFANKLSNYNDGVILDGFVRELANHHTLENICKSTGMHIFCMIHLDVPYPELVERMKNRRLVEGRLDDQEHILEKRFAVFTEKSPSFLKLYDESRKLITIKGMSPTDIVQQEILVAVQEFVGNNSRNRDKMRTLVSHAGGVVEDGIFVVKPGVLRIADAGEENSENMITFLIAGCSLETSLELIAHKEAKVARLTSSNTAVMLSPLFRVFPCEDLEPQKQFIRYVLKSDLLGSYPMHIRNMSLGCKAAFFCYTMRLGDYHNLFIGRSPNSGNEPEVREVIEMMVAQLHELYPNAISSFAEYAKMTNHSKVFVVSPQIPWSGTTKLTPAAIELFNVLNINTKQPDLLQYAEFRSRITYLAFSNQIAAPKYVIRIVDEYGHTSVVAGFQIDGKCVKEQIIGHGKKMTDYII